MATIWWFKGVMFSFYRVTEFADHLHEHFIHPCVADNGAYKVPVVSLLVIQLGIVKQRSYFQSWCLFMGGINGEIVVSCISMTLSICSAELGFEPS